MSIDGNDNKTTAMFYNNMGFRLKQIRQRQKMSQLELANALGVVMQTVQKYESGEVKISPEVIYQCARVFNVPVGYFYGEDMISGINNRVTMMIASEVIKLPSNDVRKNLFHFLRSINQIRK